VTGEVAQPVRGARGIIDVATTGLRTGVDIEGIVAVVYVEQPYRLRGPEPGETRGSSAGQRRNGIFYSDREISKAIEQSEEAI
jgi:hypothetical protein